MKVLLSLWCLYCMCFAQVAFIERLEGNVFINNKKAKLHDNIQKTDTIHTQEGKVKLLFQDTTVVSLGKNSSLQIEDFLLDSQNSRASFVTTKGVFKFVTGKIGRIAPQKFVIDTKTATIGIRGTEFAFFKKQNGRLGVLYIGLGKGVEVRNKKMFVALTKEGEGVDFFPYEHKVQKKLWSEKKKKNLISQIKF